MNTKVRTTVDILKGVEKRRYKKASKVVKKNIYEEDINNIPKLDDIKVTVKFLDTIRSFYSDTELAEYFGMSKLKFIRYKNRIYRQNEK